MDKKRKNDSPEQALGGLARRERGFGLDASPSLWAPRGAWEFPGTDAARPVTRGLVNISTGTRG